MTGPFLLPSSQGTGSLSGRTTNPQFAKRLMKPSLILAAVLLGAPGAVSAQQTIAQQYAPAADRLIGAALRDSAAYKRLGELVDRFGHRLSGSAALEQAIDWI